MNASAPRRDEEFACGEAVFEGAALAMLIVEADDGRIVDANPAACRFYGYACTAIRGLHIADLSTRPAGAALSALRHAEDDGHQPFEDAHRLSNGEVRDVVVQGSGIDAGGRRLLLAIVREGAATEDGPRPAALLTHLDSLTRLPNKALFIDRLEQSLARARRADEQFAVLFLDLDHFKDVNDTFGHLFGDELLKAFADRLRSFVRATDTVARFGGDEFVLLLTGLQDMTHSAILAQKILRSLATPFEIDGREIRISTSIGISLYHPELTRAEDYIDRADRALYLAKDEGRNTYRFHTETLDALFRVEVALGTDLHHAIERKELHLQYQPQIDLASNRIIGLEALVRWHHERRGNVRPAEFIPVAERTNQIVPLGAWVLRAACRQAHLWLEAGLLPPRIAVNLSPLQFKDAGLVGAIHDVLEETGVPADRLELEITESVIMDSLEDHHATLARLREAGIRFSIDDFGTGYSSLKHLRSFPAYKLKIAQEFIAGVPDDRNDTAIVRATIDLAHDMDLTVIAEGVETAEQAAFLRQLGCHQVQGYLFGRPLDADVATAFLKEHR